MPWAAASTAVSTDGRMPLSTLVRKCEQPLGSEMQPSVSTHSISAEPGLVESADWTAAKAPRPTPPATEKITLAPSPMRAWVSVLPRSSSVKLLVNSPLPV